MSDIPVIPPLSPEQKRNRDNPPYLNPIVAICGECGREIARMEMYYCNNVYCPLKSHITF